MRPIRPQWTSLFLLNKVAAVHIFFLILRPFKWNERKKSKNFLGKSNQLFLIVSANLPGGAVISEQATAVKFAGYSKFQNKSNITIQEDLHYEWPATLLERPTKKGLKFRNMGPHNDISLFSFYSPSLSSSLMWKLRLKTMTLIKQRPL